ncbi:MAG: HupE/UreJ family protein [Cyanobacteria bacterium P01_D01_bin.36]
MKKIISSSALGTIAIALLATPAFAHHPFGGEAPKTIAKGLLSGIGHPVIGLDHIVFVIAVGLLATIVRKGLAVPISIRYAGFTVLGAEAAFLGGLVV